MEGIDLDPVVKTRLDLVAELMLKIYQTLADLQYLDPEWIVQGPHGDIANILSQRGTIDDRILYLYSILPYVDTGGAANVDFFDGGEFVRFDNGGDLDNRQNPLYSDKRAEHLTPWMTPLSKIGNHRTTIIYGAKTHAIWILSQSAMGSVDPGLAQNQDRHAGSSRPDRNNSDTSSVDPFDNDEFDEDEDDDNSDSDGSNLSDAPDEGEEGAAFSYVDCRPAEDVLRDINKWYRELKEIPGGGEHSPEDWDQNLTEPLYRKHGWLTGKFDSEAFHRERLQQYALQEVRRIITSTWEKLQTSGNIMTSGYIERLRQREEQADSVEEKWNLSLKIFAQEQTKKRTTKKQGDTEEQLQRLFPGGAASQDQYTPLWQTEWLLSTLTAKQGSLQRLQHKIRDEQLDRSKRLQLNHARRQVNLYQMAYNASRTDSETLFPGKSFTAVTGWTSLNSQTSLEKQLEELDEEQATDEQELLEWREFLARVPEEANTTREKTRLIIERRVAVLEDLIPTKRKCLLAELEKQQA